jgi:signal peptidase I
LRGMRPRITRNALASETEDESARAPDDAADDEDDAAEAEDRADETPAPDAPTSRRPTPPGSRVLRYVFYAVWLVIAPAALAIGAVKVLEPAPSEVDAGPIRSFVGEQQVPATILCFTLFAMLLWRVRHLLPLATTVGMVGRRDLPPRLRGRFDHAAHLVDEARRIMKRHQREVAALKAGDREDLTDALAALEEAMTAEKFDEEEFHSAHEDAAEQVARRLGRWRKSELREYVESIGFAVAVALVLRFFVIEAFKIPTGSMIPTLMVGDHIFVAKYAYGPLLPRSSSRLYSRLPPARGDIMVFKYPEIPTQDFIKRTIALPGDTLEVVDGRPVLNGLLLPNCYIGKVELSAGVRGHLYLEYYSDKAYLTLFNEKQEEATCDGDLDCPGGKQCRAHFCGMVQGPYRVMPGEVWVLGDNRDNSHDSRAWHGGLGAGVPFENIKGRALFVWWSWDPRDGLALDRLLVNVMGVPKLPKGAPDYLEPALQKCLRARPPLEATTPPAP